MVADDLLGDEEFEGDAVPLPSDEALARIAALAQRQREAAKAVTLAEEALRLAKIELARVEEKELPDAMAELGLADFRLIDGARVEVKQAYHASIPADRREEAFAWLEAAGHGAVIKRDIVVGFGRGEGEAAKRLLSFLQTQFNDREVKDRQHVAPQTLNALVREQMRLGAGVPADVFGLYLRRWAEITEGKGKKP